MLKKLLTVFTLAALVFVVVRIASPFNQNPRSDATAKVRQLAVVVKQFAGVISKKENAYLQQNHLKLTGDESAAYQNFQVLSKAAALTGPGTLIGSTAYNYQTNDNLHDRIFWNPANNTIHAEWMYGDLAEAPNFAGRRMRYNYFDGTNWYRDQTGAPTLGVPIESERSGYGSLAVDANNIAVPVSHVTATNNEGSIAWLDFQPGFGFFSPLKVHRKPDNTQTRLEPLWPDIAVDRQGNFHVIAINNNQTDAAVRVLNNVRQNILYWKSTDRGASWGMYQILFPDTTTYPLSFNRAGNSQLAVSDTDNRKVGILITSAYHTLYLFESDDGGGNWKPGINITGKPRLEESASFTQHPQQFDVIQVDSSNIGGPKYIDFTEWPLWPTGGSYTASGPIDNRPPAPADLIYINGAPHVVWNEVLSVPNAWYPVGAGYSFLDPAHVFLLKGGGSHVEGGFLLKHWSPSTGTTMIARYNESPDAYAGTFSQWLTQPQLGRDASGNLYCVYTLHDDKDTLRVQGQRDTRWGPLSFGEIWGAKSADNGATWNQATRLTQTFHESERYVGISDLNPNDAIHLIYQTANIPGTAVGADDSRDHATFVNAEIRHWAVPTSQFSSTPYRESEIEISEGVLDFLNTPGTATRSFTVYNSGNADLVVDGAFVTDTGSPDPVTASDFTISPASFTLAPKGTQRVDVTYKASTTRRDTLILAIPNNDLSEHSRGLVILASATSTSVTSRETGAIPTQYALGQNYPNPISVSSRSESATAPSATEIRYMLKANGHTQIRIFDMLGREVALLVNEIKSAGEHQVMWQPSRLPAGIYFYSLEVNGFRETKKLVLLP